tara:strand:+ start:1706 stop:1972 length:267 start_codon:yes stop_codon:yes gene_type:complete
MNYDVVGRMKFKCKERFFVGIYNLIRNEVYFDANAEELTVEINPCEELYILNHKKESDFYNSIKKLSDLNLHFDAHPNHLEITLTGGF